MDMDDSLNISETSPDKRIERLFVIAYVVILWHILFLPNLGKPELQGEETRRVLPAINMLNDGDWIVPSIAGEHYFNKPPGINWPIALSYWLTGQQNEFNARLVSTLFVLAMVLVIVTGKGPWLSIGGRLLAAVIFMTCAATVEKGRLIEIEAVYLALTGIAIVWWLDFYSRQANSLVMWVVPGTVLGYSMLVKGPISVIVFYSVVISVLICTKRFKHIFRIEHLLSLALVFGPVSVWYILARDSVDTEAMNSTLSSQMTNRVLGQFNFKYWLSNVFKSFANFLPWIIFLGALWDKRSLDNMAENEKRFFKGLRLGTIIAFLILNMMPLNHPRYSLPVVAPVSLALACALSYRKELTGWDKLWRIVLLIVAFVAVISAVAGVLLCDLSVWGFVALEVSILLAFAAALFIRKFRTTFSLAVLTGAVVAGLMLQYAVFGLTFINAVGLHRIEASNIRKVIPEGQSLYIYGSKFQPVIFYLPKPLVRLSSPDEITDEVRYLFTIKDALGDEQTRLALENREVTTLYELEHGRKGQVVVVDLGQGSP